MLTLLLLLVPLLKLLPYCSHLNLHLLDSAGAFCSFWAGLIYDVCVWMGCLKEMLAKEWLMRTSAPVWRVTPCVLTTTTRGELDAWRFHDDYNGLQSVHFTEARGTLQAAVWDCTGEQRHGRLRHRLCVLLYMIHYACCVESSSRLLLLVFGKRFQTKTGAWLGVF